MIDLQKEIEKLMRECGDIMLGAVRNPSMITAKEGHANFVTTYDKAIQDRLKQGLFELKPEAVFVGEEEDIHPGINEGYAFVVDPIDGTTNFIRDYKQSCISVALLKDGEPVLGLVYNPYLDEMFSARKGEGAFLNGKPIRVSGFPVEQGIVLFGTSPYYRELNRKSFDLAYSYFEKALDIRRSGSSALDLCSIAAGRAEVFFELKLSPWDYAAGSLIVTEAGGRVTTAELEPLCFDRPCSVLAVNGS
ncbi:MAG: inositol monophosphatase [Lachnospiraceae bacterium]|nr:inositol monophosphatase [Lachnospiraceae bacterium]